MLAVTIMPVEIVGDETIEPALDTSFDPRLQNALPVRIAQAGGVFLHAADAVPAGRSWRPIGIFLQKLLFRLQFDQQLVGLFPHELVRGQGSLGR